MLLCLQKFTFHIVTACAYSYQCHRVTDCEPGLSSMYMAST